MFAKSYAEYNSLQNITCEDFRPKKEHWYTQNTCAWAIGKIIKA